MNHKELALRYAADGYPVFPCRAGYETIVDERNKPQKKKPKSPLTQYGFKEATKTARIIERWWNDRPEALVGVPTGPKSGFWVLDVDVPGEEHTEDGRPWLERMEAEHGKLETRTARTASGGRHFYWKHVEGVRNKAAIAPGVDTRGDGGYACMPGSVMPDGTFYEWENDNEIADAPEWLLEIVTRKPPELAQDYQSQQVDQPIGFDEVSELLGYVDPDCNYSDWVSVLMAIHSEFGAEGLSIADAWSSRGRKYQRGEVAQKWKRFKSGGGVGIGTLCELARQGGANLSEISRKHRGQEDWVSAEDAARMASGLLKPKKELKTSAETSACDSESHDSGNEQPAPPAKILVATPFIYRDPSLIPRREFLYGRHYVRKYLTATFGAGGGGKSANAVTEALAMCTGRPLLGGPLQEPLRVWYINAEDDPVEIERRFAGAIKHYNIRPEQIGDRLFTDSGRQQSFVVMTEDGKKTRVCEPIVRAFKDEVRDKQIDVSIVDPFVSTHEVEENDNSKIQRVATQWVLIAEEAGCAIELIHHVTKNNMEITADSGRGAGALKDKCRSVRTINQMTDAEATEAAIPQSDRLGYFRIDFGKANLAKRTGKSDWRRFQSVKLGNGKGNLASINGDEIGVVVPWEWPSSEKIAEGLTPEQLTHLKVTLDNGNYKAAPNSKEWAGLAVAYVMGVDTDDKSNRRHAGAILKALLKEGVLEQVTEKDPITRMSATFVRSAKDASMAA